VRTYATDRAPVVFRAVLTRKWTHPDTKEVITHTEYAGPYTRLGDAQRSATRITKWWRYRDDLVVTTDFQQANLDWQSLTPVDPDPAPELQNVVELPGMWEAADLIGGETDAA
jgi:hypothetical protein